MLELRTDSVLLFATRWTRLFAYGLLSVVLVLYLVELGLNEAEVGLLLTLTLLGDTIISLLITVIADRVGRRKMLVVGAILMVAASVVFAATDAFVLLLLAATIGVISPSGNEVGPFLPLEQAALSQIVPDRRRTSIFAWYNLTGSFATAIGSLSGGLLAAWFQRIGRSGAEVYRPTVIAYGVLGAVLLVLFSFVSKSVEVRPNQEAEHTAQSTRFGLHRSRGVVFRLSILFAMDAFGGGFVIQSIVAYWFHLRFGADPATLGEIFLAANLLAGISALVAGWLADRIGLINTMVFTHLPSNVLLMLVPMMPTFGLAVFILLLRFMLSQMDVPTRQSYTMAVVSPEERSAAAGITGVARSLGASISPMLASIVIGTPALTSVPFFLAGGIKVVYDLLLYRRFVALRPRNETEGQ